MQDSANFNNDRKQGPLRKDSCFFKIYLTFSKRNFLQRCRPHESRDRRKEGKGSPCMPAGRNCIFCGG